MRTMINNSVRQMNRLNGYTQRLATVLRRVMPSGICALLAVWLMLNCSALPARADLIFTLDLDPVADNIQNDLALSGGSDFRVNVILEQTAGTSLNLYGISVGFDTASLVFLPALSSETPPSAFTSNFQPLSRNGNVILGIEAGTAIGANGPTTPFKAVIASLAFTAPPGDFGTIHFTLFEGLLDGSFDNGFNPVAPTLNNATLRATTVPEPTPSLLLLLQAILVCSMRVRARTARCGI